MPGNDIPEIVHNFFNHDNSSQNQSQFSDGGWSVLNNNQRTGFQRQSGAQSSPHTSNDTSRAAGLEHGNGMQPAQSFFLSNPSSKTDLVISQPINQHSIMNGYMHNSQGSSFSTGQRLVHKNISPYERPESTEAPVNFNFLGGQRQLVRSQRHGNPQPFQIQTQRISDMQLWQQQVMQQQLLLHMQQGRQLKPDQIQSALSGMPVNTVSNKGNNIWSNEHGNMNWVQRSTMQGMIPNGFMFSHDQNQSIDSASAASTRDEQNHQSQFQGTHEISQDFASAIDQNRQVGHTEEKLLFSAGGKENQEACSNIQSNLMQIDENDSFPTMNSGSWSALMQDAVEASSSDTGVNEEWSGLKLPSSTANNQSLNSTLPLFSDADTSSNFNQPMNFTSQQNEAAIYKTFDQQKQQTQLNNISNDVLVPQEQLHLHRQLSNNINGWSSAQSVKPTVGKSFNYHEDNGKKQHDQIHETVGNVNVGTQHTQESRHMALSRNQVNYPPTQFLHNRKAETARKYKNEQSSFVYNELEPGQNQSRNETQMLVNSSNIGQKDAGPHMFHYHPMGSVDLSNEPMGPTQSVGKHQDQIYGRQPQFLGHSWNNGSDSVKGHFSNLQRNKNAADELKYGGPDQSTSDYSQSLQAGSTSQNMLELLDKMDRSAVVKKVDQNTQIDRRNSDPSNRLSSQFQPNQSPSYQEFGLKLAPPSQRQSFTDHVLSSQPPLHVGNGFIPRNADSGVNIEAPSHDTSTEEENHGQKNKEAVHSNIQMANQPQWKQPQHKAPQQYQPLQQQQQQKQNFSIQLDSQNCQSSLEGTSNSQAKNANSGVNKPEIRAVRPCVTSAVSQQGGISKMLHNVWTNISSEQHITGVPPQKFMSNLLHKADSNHKKREGEDCTENQGAKANSSKEMPPPLNVEFSSVQKQHNNYSLLQQVESLRNGGPVPTQRADSRLKGVDFSVNTSHIGQRYIYGQNTVLRETDNVHKISSDVKDNNNTMNTSHDRLKPHFIQNQPPPNISPQMAPMWFEKYGNSTNYKPNEASYSKNETVSCEDDVLSKKRDQIETEAATESDKTVTCKKRKSATKEVVPWHMEVTRSLVKLPSITVTERNWASSTNRLVDKVEDEIEGTNGRPRRRLKLTTHLMQQILPSIPPTYISAKEGTSYENVTYLVAKSLLGDACNLISFDSGSASKFVDEITARSKKIEAELFRLEERDSLLDVRLKCEEVCKEAVMNRFVKFHGGYQSAASTSHRKIYPQRQVTPQALPTILPEGADCVLL